MSTAPTGLLRRALGRRGARRDRRSHAEGRLPILVGGTGLYIRTLLDGIAPVPAIDPAIRAEVRALPVAEAHAQLADARPAAAARLHPADTTRVARALEVVRSTGRTLADWQQRPQRRDRRARSTCAPPSCSPTRLAERPHRRALRDDGRRRRGDEVAALLARTDMPADAPIRRAIGVPEIAALVRGEIDPRRGHRRRQRRDPAIRQAPVYVVPQPAPAALGAATEQRSR